MPRKEWGKPEVKLIQAGLAEGGPGSLRIRDNAKHKS
jgi:hypothetical protein